MQLFFILSNSYFSDSFFKQRFSVSAIDIKITDTDNNLTITEKSLTEFTFVNHLSDIQTMMVKTKAGNFVKLIV